MPYISQHLLEWEKEVYGDSGDLYTVKWGENKFTGGHRANDNYQWSCDCPSFMYQCRPNSAYCKHIEGFIKDDPRCMWTDTDGELPLFHGLTVDILRTMRRQATNGNFPLLSTAVNDALNAMTAYCPFEWNGEFVQAKYVSDEEWVTEIKPVAYTYSRNIMTEGELSSKQFSLLLRFITTGQKADWKQCVIAGFDVNGSFSLSSSKVNEKQLCPTCDSPQVSLKDYSPDVYACVNSDCSGSINQPDMIEARQARAKSYGLQVYKPTQAEIQHSKKQTQSTSKVFPDFNLEAGNKHKDDIE